MSLSPIRYQSAEEDSGRWNDFSFRDGDVVISTRSKSGTTWMQMICALLIFQNAELPEPLADLSPWLDWLIAPRDEVVAHLERQTHRRFIKTHTPLDGIPLDPRQPISSSPVTHSMRQSRSITRPRISTARSTGR